MTLGARLASALAAAAVLLLGAILPAERGLEAGQAAQRAPVAIAPPRLSSVSLNGGAFTLWVTIDDLDHHGSIGYDDNRDTVPDRFVPSVGFGGFEMTMTYDPALLDVEVARPGNLSGESDRSFSCLQRRDGPGSYAFGCYSTGDGAGRQGSFTLAQVTFMPVGPGTGVVELEDVELSGPFGDDIPVQISNRATLINIPGGGGPPDDDDSKKPPDDPNGGAGPDDANRPGDPEGSEQGPNDAKQPGGESDPVNDPKSDVQDRDGDGRTDNVSSGGEDDDVEGGEGSVRDNGASDGESEGQQGANSGSANDGGGGLGLALWAAVIAGGVIAAGGAGMAVLLWRRP